MKHFCLADFTRKYVGLPYALGSREHPDCFSLIFAYLQARGVELPDEYEGITIETYAELFERDPGEAKRIMVEFVASLTDEIPPHAAFAGDILLLRLKGSDTLPFLALHGGQNVAVASSCEFGVKPWPLNHYEILRAFRCRKPSR